MYASASVAIASAFNVESFLALRLIQGLGAGGISVMARVLVRDSFSGTLLAKGLSWLGMTFAIALGIGQFLGSLLQAAFGWKAIFYSLAIGHINAGVAARDFSNIGEGRFVGVSLAHLHPDSATPRVPACKE